MRSYRIFIKDAKEMLYSKTDSIIRLGDFCYFRDCRTCGKRNPIEGFVDMDSTGIELYDRELYEGDIVRAIVEGEVSYHEIQNFSKDNYPAFDLYPHLDVESNGISYLMVAQGCDIEIIGNKYENPKLMELIK